MKKQEKQSLRQKPIAELEKMLKESREHLRDLRFNLDAGKLKNVGEIHAVKKVIARIQTFLRNPS